jgi:hypothetical protein
MFDAGILPDFFAETAHIRNSDWKARLDFGSYLLN